MRHLILAAILSLGLLGGTAAVTTGQAAASGSAATTATELMVPVQYRPDYHRPHYAPPPRHHYRRHYAPPRRPYYRQHYAPPPRSYQRHY
jgi:hypothetical protein